MEVQDGTAAMMVGDEEQQADAGDLEVEEEDSEFVFNEYSIDDGLDPLSRLERYRTSEFSLLRMVLARDLPETAKESGRQETLQRLVPLLAHFLNDVEPAVRQTFAEQMPPLAEYLCSPEGTPEEVEAGYRVLIQNILPYTGDLLSDKNSEISQRAVVSYLRLCELVQPADVDHVLKKVIELAGDKTEENRIISAQLFDGLAPFFGPELCLSTVIEEVTAIADDTAFSVRKTVASHLGKLCETVGPQAAVEKVLPIFQDLSRDMIWGVRKACAESIVEVSEVVTPEARAGKMHEIFKFFFDDVSRWVRYAASQKLGPFMHTFGRGQYPESLLKTFIEVVAHPGESDLAEHCAFNFPAVAQVLGRESWCELDETFHALVKDVQWKVRKSMSSSLHEIAKIVGPEITERSLTRAFDVFLRDLDTVRSGCLQNSPAFIEMLTAESRERYIAVICSLPAENGDGGWRHRMLVGGILGDLAQQVSPAFVKEHIAPVIKKLLDDIIADVRSVMFRSAAQVLARLETGDSGEHIELRDALLKYEGEVSFQKRQMLPQLAREVGIHASSELFAADFLPALERLAQDKVVNVRIVVARALTDPEGGLCRQKEWCEDHRLLEIIDRLRADGDRDVAHFADQLRAQSPGPPAAAASAERRSDDGQEAGGECMAVDEGVPE